MPSKRHLAAIMFTDLEGYSSAMHYNEDYGLFLRKEHRKIFKSTTLKYRGEIIQYFGDGTLSVFDSAVDAVNCGIEMQLQWRKNNMIPVRIGIHLGDIVTDDHDIIGDGVNIASRIETLGIAGSVLISKKVHDEINNKESIKTKSIGNFKLKNISEPKEVFVITNEGLYVPGKKEIIQKAKIAGTATDIKTTTSTKINNLIGLNQKTLGPIFILIIFALLFYMSDLSNSLLPGSQVDVSRSIAVLPFKNFSEEPSKQYIADGVMEALLSNLAKIKSLRVISRTSTEQYRGSKKSVPQIGGELNVLYILEGSTQQLENKTRITVQLIEAKNDHHIWSESYDYEHLDIFTVQSKIAQEVANELDIQITINEKEVIDNPLTKNLDAYHLYQRARVHFINFILKRDKVEYNKAMEFYTECLALDSTIANVYSEMAEMLWLKDFRTNYFSASFMDDVYHLCQKALHYDQDHAFAHVMLGRYYLYNQQPEKGVQYLRKAIKLNSNLPVAHIDLGNYYVGIGKWEDGIHSLMDGISLSPVSIFSPYWYGNLAFAFLSIGDFEKSNFYTNKMIELGGAFDERGTERDANFLFTHMNVVQGNADIAMQYAKKLYKFDSLAGLRYFAEINCNLLNNCSKAMTYIDEMKKLDPDFPYFDYKNRYAYILWMNGQREEAREAFKEQIQTYERLKELDRRYSNDPFYNLAGAYAFMGDHKKAYENLKKFPFVSGLEHYILLDPLFKELWHEKEFQDIIMKAKSEKEKIRSRIKDKLNSKL